MSKSKQSQSTQVDSAEQGSASSQNKKPQSNSAQQEKLRAQQKEQGIESYASALGSLLGPKLYEAIHDFINEDELKGLATGAIESALSSLLEYAGEQTENPILQNEQLINSASKEVSKQLEGVIEKWLAGPQGAKLINALQGWAGAHPYTITAIAILAAAAAVITDMDIPTLKTKFKMGSGLSASLEAKLGSFQNLALEEAKAKLEYNRSNLSAAVEVQHGDKGTSGAVSAKLGDKKRFISGKAKLDETGLTAYELAGMYTFGEKTKLTAGASSANGSEINNIRLGVETKQGTTKFSGNIKYDPTKGTLRAAYDQADDKGFKLGASLLANTQSGQADKFNAYMGHQKEGSFDSMMGKYSYDFDTQHHDLNLQAQKQFGDFKVRGTQNFGFDQQSGLSSQTELMGAYALNDRMSVLGGAEYKHDQMGGRVLPKLGVQIDDVPITLTFDPQTKEAKIGFSIKF